jgi:hypothetical protein
VAGDDIVVLTLEMRGRRNNQFLYGVAIGGCR